MNPESLDPAPLVGTVGIIKHYGWRRVGILADESLWARGTLRLFTSLLKQHAPGCVITNEGNTSFSHTAFGDAEVHFAPPCRTRRFVTRCHKQAKQKVARCQPKGGPELVS